MPASKLNARAKDSPQKHTYLETHWQHEVEQKRLSLVVREQVVPVDAAGGVVGQLETLLKGERVAQDQDLKQRRSRRLL